MNGFEPASQVCQHGLFSFTRIYQSSHMVPAYRPKEAYKILHRAMQQNDIATRSTTVTSNYSTNGTFNSTATLKPPPPHLMTCYLEGSPLTCAENQIKAVKNGTAVIENGAIREPPGTCPSPSPNFQGKFQSNTKEEGNMPTLAGMDGL